MGCQDLLEAVPGRGRVTSVPPAAGSVSDGKSLKVRAGLSGRSANGEDDQGRRSVPVSSHLFTPHSSSGPSLNTHLIKTDVSTTL